MRAQELPFIRIIRRIAVRLATAMVVVLLLGLVVYFLDRAPDMPGYVKQAPQGEFVKLDWDELTRGKWDGGGKPACPASVMAANGKQVEVCGFITPFHEAGASAVMFVTGQPRGCYFCNPPGVSEVVMVKVKGGRKLDQATNSVNVYGKFKVADGSGKDESLYVIEDAELMVLP